MISGPQSHLQKQSFKNTTQIEFCRNTLIGRRNLNLMDDSKKTGVQNFDNENSVDKKELLGILCEGCFTNFMQLASEKLHTWKVDGFVTLTYVAEIGPFHEVSGLNIEIKSFACTK